MNNQTVTGSDDPPFVAVVGQWRERQGRVPLPYVEAVARAGAHPRVISTFDVLPMQDVPASLGVSTGLDPFDPSPLDRACGLVLPGGGDIDPQWYGQKAHRCTKNVSHRRDHFERTLLAAALERDMPVLAICHGMQLLNVHLGGSLLQHLPDVTDIDHDQAASPMAEVAHEVELVEGSLLAECLGRRCAGVNSHHHQAVERLGHGLEIVARAPDGIIEAIEARGYSWVAGVQWHPEAMARTDPVQMRLFECFAQACNLFAEMELHAEELDSA